MANQVFANGMEIACKAGAGKVIAAFPDVCMTPPENPATPPGIPIPYPNTGCDSDTTDGSKSVKISDKEIMLKNKSCFKTSTGDEAGSAAKKGLISSKNKGKVYFIKWSMDVKVEGENVDRHFDMTTNNHGSPTTNEGIPWTFLANMTSELQKDCDGDISKEKDACEDYKPNKEDGIDVCKAAGVDGAFSYDKQEVAKRTKTANEDPCMAARRCRLVPFNAKPQDGITGCCLAQTGDHIVPKSSFFKIAVPKLISSAVPDDYMEGWADYDIKTAPCMCLEGGSNTGSHGLRHAHHKAFSPIKSGNPVPFDDEVKHCAGGAKAVAPGCSQDCIEAQLRAGHANMCENVNEAPEVKHSSTGQNFIEMKDDLLRVIDSVLPSGR